MSSGTVLALIVGGMFIIGFGLGYMYRAYTSRAMSAEDRAAVEAATKTLESNTAKLQDAVNQNQPKGEQK